MRLRTNIRQGATLIEVLVACGLFLLVMIATIFFYDLSQRSNRKATVHSDAYREAALALRHVRRELKGVEISKIGDLNTLNVGDQGGKLEYLVPDFRDHRVVVDFRGNPAWAVEHQLRVTPDGALMLSERPASSDASVPFTDIRQLADMGSGDISFEITDAQLLKVTVAVEKVGTFRSEGNRSRRELTLTVGLANQQFWQDLVILEKS